MTHSNLAANPRFHANITDGWIYGSTYGTAPSWDDSPPVALPSGCDAALHIPHPGSPYYARSYTARIPGSTSVEIPVSGGPCNMRFFAYVPTAVGDFW